VDDECGAVLVEDGDDLKQACGNGDRAFSMASSASATSTPCAAMCSAFHLPQRKSKRNPSRNSVPRVGHYFNKKL
jgi:hypothetical protein